jgi:tRNA (cmo5U34)-methyltransferase
MAMKHGAINDFNRIASVYDTLASLVFGKVLTQSQHHFLYIIPENATVLVIGGGSGELLQTLLEKKPHCQVVYVDASEKMIALARQRVKNSSRVTFLCGTEEIEMPRPSFTVIITNFYLDLFTVQSLQRIIIRLRALMTPGGLWLVTDFVNPAKLWQRILLKSMYIFFRTASNIEASHIADWEKIMQSTGLFCQAKKMFYTEMIRSAVFRDATSPLRNPEDN